MPLVLSTRKRLGFALAIAAIAAGGIGVALASDHQDSPNVELNPLQDLTDVYAFPSPTAGRIVLVMNTRAFLTPAQSSSAAFDGNQLYQFKIDNTGDAIEDKVIQITFDGSGSAQQVRVRGPVAPPVLGAMANKVSTSAVAVRLVLPGPRAVFPDHPRPEARHRRTLAAAQHAVGERFPPGGTGPELSHRLQHPFDRGRAAHRRADRGRHRQARHLGHHQPVNDPFNVRRKEIRRCAR
jgi:hypothetical protein